MLHMYVPSCGDIIGNFVGVVAACVHACMQWKPRKPQLLARTYHIRSINTQMHYQATDIVPNNANNDTPTIDIRYVRTAQ